MTSQGFVQYNIVQYIGAPYTVYNVEDQLA